MDDGKLNKLSKLFLITCFIFLSSQAFGVNLQSWDVDKNGETDALTDGLLMLRHMFDVSGENLTLDAVSPNSQISNQDVIQSIEETMVIADIDKSGHVDALSDGLILLRYMFDMRGPDLLDDAVTESALRRNHSDVLTYIDMHQPQKQTRNYYLESSKFMVADVRNFSMNASYESSEELFILNKLSESINFVNNDELDRIYGILNKALEVIGDAYSEITNVHMSFEPSSSSLIKFNDSLFAYDSHTHGITVMISVVNGEYSYSIDTNIDSTVISISANSAGKNIQSHQMNSSDFCGLDYENFDEEGYDNVLKQSATASFKLSGSLTSDNAVISIPNGNAHIIHNCSFLAELDTNKLQAEDYIDFLFDLDLVVTDLSADKPLEFSGNVKVGEIISSTYSTLISSNELYNQDGFVEQSILRFSGKLKSNERSTKINFHREANSIIGEPIDNSQISNIQGESSTITNINFSNISENALERANNIVEMALENSGYDLSDLLANSSGNFGISLEFDSPILSNLTGISLIIESFGEEEFNLNLNISLGEKSLYFEFSAMPDFFITKITNQNGVLLQIIDTCNDAGICTQHGKIIFNDNEIATISYDSESELTVISYIDGYSELLTM